MSGQTIAVIIIIALAVAYGGWRIYKTLSGGGCCSGGEGDAPPEETTTQGCGPGSCSGCQFKSKNCGDDTP